MRKILLYENFVSDYVKMLSSYRDSKKELWMEYRNTIGDIFSDMCDDYDNNGLDSFLLELDRSLLNGEEQFFNSSLADGFSDRLLNTFIEFYVESSNLDDMINHIVECSNKFDMIKDSFELDVMIVYHGSGNVFGLGKRRSTDWIKLDEKSRLNIQSIIKKQIILPIGKIVHNKDGQIPDGKITSIFRIRVVN